jgi:dihydroxy-acid dehydratase
VIKPAACNKAFLVHEGPAYVFDSYPELKARIDDESWDIPPDAVLVLRNAGPQGGPGMPEWGMIPMPKSLLKKGHRDMVRLSDARMSGTSFGACVLHVSPEAYVGGPLALLRNGDRVKLDVPGRRLDMLVSEEELAARRAAWTAPEKRYERGYGWMFSQHILQADKGCDFDYLETGFGGPVGEPEIY